MKNMGFVLVAIFLFLTRLAFSEDLPKGSDKSYYSMYILAQKLMSQGNDEAENKAIVLLEKLSECKNPKCFQQFDKVLSFQMLSKVYLKHRYYDTHFNCIQRLLQEEHWKNDRVFLWVELSRSFLFQKRYDRAFQILQSEILPIASFNLQRETLAITSLIQEMDAYFLKMYMQVKLLLQHKNYKEASEYLTCYLFALEEKITPLEHVSGVMRNVQIQRLSFWNALCFYHLGKYEDAGFYLQKCQKDFFSRHESLKSDFPTMLLLQVACYKKLKKNEEVLKAYDALFCFSRKKEYIKESSIIDAITYAISCKKWSKALIYTNHLLKVTNKVQTKEKALLIKSAILLEMQKSDKALQVCFDLKNASAVSFQMNCLKAKAYYLQSNYEKGAKILERALFLHGKIKPCGYVKALVLLGNCYLHQLTRDLISASSEVFCERAMNCFEEALSSRWDFAAFLGLLHVDLLRYYSEKNENYIEDIKLRFFSYENKLTEDQKRICALLFLPLHKEINLEFCTFEMCEKNARDEQSFLITQYYKALWSKDEKEIIEFMKIFESVLSKQKIQPGLIVQFATLFFYQLPTPEACLKIIQQSKEHKIQNLESEQELLFLECLSNALQSEAEQHFDDYLQVFPKGGRAKDVQVLKATFLIQEKKIEESKKILNPILAKESYSLWYQDALFLKKVLDEDVPLNRPCHWSDVAYFFRYSMEEYQTGSKDAVAHLENAPFLEENSFYAMAAHYFIGNAYKSKGHSKRKSEDAHVDIKKALFHFGKVENYCRENKNKTNAQNFLFHVELETLVGYEALAKKDIDMYHMYENYVFRVHSEIQQYIESFFEKKEPISPQVLLMAQNTYLKVCQNMKRRKCFEEAKKMLCKFTCESLPLSLFISKYLVHAHCLLSKLYLNEGQFEKSLEILCAIDAKLSIEKHKELLLEVMVAKSYCFYKMKKYDRAILLLSQVINEDCISSLRVRAMLYRAKVYEALHRPDLAIKQLQACARKGGDWAKIAKKRLEKSYGYIWDERIAS